MVCSKNVIKINILHARFFQTTLDLHFWVATPARVWLGSLRGSFSWRCSWFLSRGPLVRMCSGGWSGSWLLEVSSSCVSLTRPVRHCERRMTATELEWRYCRQMLVVDIYHAKACEFQLPFRISWQVCGKIIMFICRDSLFHDACGICLHGNIVWCIC